MRRYSPLPKRLSLWRRGVSPGALTFVLITRLRMLIGTLDSVIFLSKTFSALSISSIRQQFLMGTKCSIYLYRNSFGANQCLTLTRKSFRIPHVSHILCSSAGLTVGQCSAAMGLTPCMLCVQMYCLLCVFDYYILNS